MEFAHIKDIEIEDEASWSDKIFLTLDVEWASDEVLSYVLNKILQHEVKITIFCTHESLLLDKMLSDSRIELGIHPNFNFLLNGDHRYGKSIDEVISHWKRIVPEACSIRSHCVTNGELFHESFSNHGLKYDCNYFLPQSSGIEARPWHNPSKNLIFVPVTWEDDDHCMYKWPFDAKRFVNHKGLKVFSFHPVTILLNIESIDRYYNSKPFYMDYKKLLRNRNPNVGIETFLEDLICEVKK